MAICVDADDTVLNLAHGRALILKLGVAVATHLESNVIAIDAIHNRQNQMPRSILLLYIKQLISNN